jgi:hypothetical protein
MPGCQGRSAYSGAVSRFRKRSYGATALAARAAAHAIGLQRKFQFLIPVLLFLRKEDKRLAAIAALALHVVIMRHWNCCFSLTRQVRRYGRIWNATLSGRMPVKKYISAKIRFRVQSRMMRTFAKPGMLHITVILALRDTRAASGLFCSLSSHAAAAPLREARLLKTETI